MTADKPHLPTDPVPDFPNKSYPHLRSDGAVCCVQCGFVLTQPDGTNERMATKVTSRLTVPATVAPIPRNHPMYGSGAVAWHTPGPVVCGDRAECIQAAEADPRWLKANEKGYESSILIAPPGSRLKP
jgi:hypothetical protein